MNGNGKLRGVCCLVLLPLACTVGGCGKDARIKRQASYVNTVTQVTAREFNAADTLEEKWRIADTFFKRMPKHTQNLEDYLHGREPSGPSPEEVRKRAKAEAVDAPGREGVSGE
jgi:hypothetical protein